MIEADTLSSELIDVGASDMVRAVAPQLGAEIVHRDKEDIKAFSRLGPRVRGRGRSSCGEEEEEYDD